MKQNLFSNILKQGLGMFTARLGMLSLRAKRSNLVMLVFLASMVMFTSCEPEPMEPDPPPAVKNPPGTFALTSPANSSKSPTQSITFSWGTSQHASSYQLVIKQGSTVVHNQSYSGTSATVELELGQSYSWQVTASNDDGTLESSSYSFSVMDEPVEAVVTVIQQAVNIGMTFDEITRTISLSVPSDFDWVNLHLVLEVETQGCSSCQREQVDIRPVASLAELQQPIAVRAYTVFYFTLTVSKLPPGEAQVSSTRSFYPQFHE